MVEIILASFVVILSSIIVSVIVLIALLLDKLLLIFLIFGVSILAGVILFEISTQSQNLSTLQITDLFRLGNNYDLEGIVGVRIKHPKDTINKLYIDKYTDACTGNTVEIGVLWVSTDDGTFRISCKDIEKLRQLANRISLHMNVRIQGLKIIDLSK